MNTIGRILIITFVFVLFAGLMVAAVDLIGMNLPNFDGKGQTEFRPPNGEDNGPTVPVEGERGRGVDIQVIRLILGMGKNVVIIAILVGAIVWPKSILKKRKRLSQQV